MIHAHPHMKLGKLAPKNDPRTLKLAKYLDENTLPTQPDSLDWGNNVPAWGMMDNDRLGDCTCAAAGHMIMCWTSQETHLFVPPDDAILHTYEAVSGYNPNTGQNDNGAVEVDVLNYWRRHGIARHKIAAYASVNPKLAQEAQQACWLFGGLYIGIALPLSAQSQAVWDVPAGGAHGHGAPGSWGGHAVPIIGYDKDGLTCITWAERKRMTWAFWSAYVDEAYAVLSHDWAMPSKKSPSGFLLADLLADLKKVA